MSIHDIPLFSLWKSKCQCYSCFLCLGICRYVQMEAGSHLRCMPSSYLCRTVSVTLEVGDYARLSRQQVTVIYSLDLDRSGLQTWDSLPFQVLMLVKQVLYHLSYIPSSVTVRFVPISKLFVFFFFLNWYLIDLITSSVRSLIESSLSSNQPGPFSSLLCDLLVSSCLFFQSVSRGDLFWLAEHIHGHSAMTYDILLL